MWLDGFTFGVSLEVLHGLQVDVIPLVAGPIEITVHVRIKPTLVHPARRVGVLHDNATHRERHVNDVFVAVLGVRVPVAARVQLVTCRWMHIVQTRRIVRSALTSAAATARCLIPSSTRRRATDNCY